VVRHANREILHAEVTRHPTAAWAAQQIVECCAWDRAPPRFLIHDRDSRYGASFDRRVRHLGIRQVRTPFRSLGPCICFQRAQFTTGSIRVRHLL
jgi:hypothetical protein